MNDPTAVIEQMIALAGIAPSDEERQALIEALPVHRTSIEALYRVPGVRYELPALGWDAVP